MAEEKLSPDGQPNAERSWEDQIEVGAVRGDGHRLAVSTGQAIRIFDLRAMEKPLFDIQMKKAKSIALTSTALFASPDYYNKLEIFSLHTGEHVRQIIPRK